MGEVTFYRFYSEIKAFLGQLMRTPLMAKPSEYLIQLGLNKNRLIKLLMQKGVLYRDEKIIMPDGETINKPQYQVKYTVPKKNFERSIKRIHAKLFDKNLPNELNEDVYQPSVFADEEKMKQDILKNPKDKEMYLNRGGMKTKGKRIKLTEEQFKAYVKHCLKEEGATTTFSVGADTSRGDIGYDSPKAIAINKKDPSLSKEGRSPKSDMDSLFGK